MTAYGAACSCGWSVGPHGNARRKRSSFARWYVEARERLHARRCPR